MLRIPTELLRSVALACMLALAAISSPATEKAPRQILVEQKLRLLEMLLRPRSGEAPGTADPELAAIRERRRQLHEQAQAALAEGRLADAERSLDEALARTGRPAATGQAGQKPLQESALDADIRNLEQQIASYRSTLLGLAKGEGAPAGEARALLARIDQFKAAADRAVSAHQRQAAHDKLREAYRFLVEGISRLQAGQTLVMRLKFDSPQDEFAYERRRFSSNEMLVRMMQDDKAGEGAPQRVLVEALTAEADRLKDEAEQQAWRGEHSAAVGLMEQASGVLTRALRALGVPAF